MHLKCHRRTAQRAKLHQDGRKAIAMIDSGLKPSDALMIVGGSRARLYRAMALIDEDYVAPPDPLLT